jgi:uncharacterized protein (DUF427 family)
VHPAARTVSDDAAWRRDRQGSLLATPSLRGRILRIPRIGRPPRALSRRGTRMKALWNGAVLADSDDTVDVEGNHYFPASSLDMSLFRPSDRHTECGWKGTASYYDICVAGQVNAGAAWYYPEPKAAAAAIRGRVAFWKGVQVVA